MIKKVIIVAGVVLVLGIFVFGAGALSYVRTSAGYVKDSVRNAVPIEFQIQRARHEIENLVPEVRKNTYVIAKEEVEVLRLEEQTAEAEKGLKKDKGEIMRLNSDLGTGKDVFRYAGASYSASEVKIDLANRFERFKVNEATLGSLRQILDARQCSLDAAHDKLKAMLAKRRQLKVEVENLDQVRTVLVTDADRVLLDNMNLEMLREAVEVVGGKVVTEASGGITLDNVREIAETGVDVISVGWITHSAPQLDIALDFRSDR